LEAKHIPLLESWVTDVETSIGYIRSSGMPTSCLPSHDRASRATVQFPQHRRATTVEIWSLQHLRCSNYTLVNNPPDKCFVFSLQMFRERSLKRAQGPIRERKAEA